MYMSTGVLSNSAIAPDLHHGQSRHTCISMLALLLSNLNTTHSECNIAIKRLQGSISIAVW